MSAAEIIKELPKLSEAERRVVLEKLRELTAQDADVELCDQTAGQGAAQLDRLEETGADYRAVNRVMSLLVFQEWYEMYLA